MNAGRDVERLIAHWLAEEADVRAPDRVLESTRRTIDRTLQRRWVAAWRESVTLTMTKTAALAAGLVLALAGAAWLGRATAPVGGATAAPTTTPSGSTAAVTLEAYREAHDAICVRYRGAVNPLKPWLTDMYDPGLSESERADRAEMLGTVADQFDGLAMELGAMDVPAELARGHDAQVSDWQSIARLLHQALARLEEGDLAGAQALDAATDSYSGGIVDFETRYDLLHCP
jgi:hypothetical protein